MSPYTLLLVCSYLLLVSALIIWSARRDRRRRAELDKALAESDHLIRHFYFVRHLVTDKDKLPPKEDWCDICKQQ